MSEPRTPPLRAPFSPTQVEALNRWQATRRVHPFTCGNRENHPLDPEGDYGVLVATESGWVCRHCDYTQSWAHDFMTTTIGEPWFADHEAFFVRTPTQRATADTTSSDDGSPR